MKKLKVILINNLFLIFLLGCQNEYEIIEKPIDDFEVVDIISKSNNFDITLNKDKLVYRVLIKNQDSISIYLPIGNYKLDGWIDEVTGLGLNCYPHISFSEIVFYYGESKYRFHEDFNYSSIYSYTELFKRLDPEETFEFEIILKNNIYVINDYRFRVKKNTYYNFFCVVPFLYENQIDKIKDVQLYNQDKVNIKIDDDELINNFSLFELNDSLSMPSEKDLIKYGKLFKNRIFIKSDSVILGNKSDTSIVMY